MSSEYGWKTEYILSRTLKEIGWRVTEIRRRNNELAKFEMNIHGMTTKEEKVVRLDENQKKTLDEAMKKAKERKKHEQLITNN